MIDTTKRVAVLELYYAGVVILHNIDSVQKHNETLLNNVEQLLTSASIGVSDLTHLACVTGPGSFTGIRVGMATIKAFAVAQGAPILSGNVFEIVAKHVQNGCMLLHSTAHTFYYADITKGKVEHVGVVEEEQRDAFLKEHKNLFCLLEESLQFKEMAKVTIIENYSYLMSEYFKDLAIENKTTEPAKFEPFYVQLSQAERQLNQKKGNKKAK